MLHCAGYVDMYYNTSKENQEATTTHVSEVHLGTRDKCTLIPHLKEADMMMQNKFCINMLGAQYQNLGRQILALER